MRWRPYRNSSSMDEIDNPLGYPATGSQVGLSDIMAPKRYRGPVKEVQNPLGIQSLTFQDRFPPLVAMVSANLTNWRKSWRN